MGFPLLSLTRGLAGIVESIGISAYDASKHVVIGLTKTVAPEYAGKGIRINAVYPAGVNTPMLQRFTGNDSELKNLIFE